MTGHEEWLAALNDADEEKRRQAVKRMGESRDRSLLPALVEAMGDPSWRVRKEAAEAVLGFDDPSLVNWLLPGLRDGQNAGRRNAVVETAIRLGPSVLGDVAGLMGDSDPDVRKFAVDILGGLKVPEMVPVLIEALGDEEENVVASAVEYLGQEGDIRAIPSLLDLLRRGSFWLKFCALRAIGQLADEEQEAEVIPFLEDPALRLEAIGVLARIGGDASLERLIQWHGQGSSRERAKIMEAVADILWRRTVANDERAAGTVAVIRRAGLKDALDAHLSREVTQGRGEEKRKAILLAGLCPSREVLEAMVGVIETSEEEEREDIIRALAQFPDEQLAALLPHLASESTLVRRKVASIFGRRGYAPALTRLLPLVQDEDGHVRAAVAAALGRIGDKSAVMPLFNLLRDPYPDVREAAVAALSRVAAGEESAGSLVREIVRAALDEGQEQLAEGGLLVLGDLREEELTPLFSRYLKDARIRVRRAALEGLGRLGTPSAMDLVLTSLTDEDPGARVEALRFLGHSGEAGYLQAVTAMVQDEDDVVAAEALKALGQLGGAKSLGVLAEQARISAGLRQLAAVKAICSLGGQEAAQVLVEMMDVLPMEGRREVIAFLGRGAGKTMADRLLPALEDPEWSIRLAAVEALGRLEDPLGLAAVESRYLGAEKDPLVRRAMESTLKARG